ncbi:MAG: DHHA1 domain-containing protein [Methanobacteriota archaeon]
MLERVRQRLSQGGFLVIVHDNADVDAVASAAALFFTYDSCSIAAPGGLSRHGKSLAEKLGLDIFKDRLLECPLKTVVVDAAGAEMVSAKLPPDPIIIDHHRESESWAKYYRYIDATKASCCEVVLDIIRPILNERSAAALLYGIVADSGGFRHAKPSTFRDFAELLDKSGAEAGEAFAFFQEMPDDMSQRIARLKAAQRMRFVQEGDYLVAASVIGAHEAEVCRMMLAMGCDVSFAGRQERGEFRLSGRARADAEVSLAEIFAAVGAEFGGSGGGHDCAAGLSGKGDVEAALGACVARTVEILQDRDKKK